MEESETGKEERDGEGRGTSESAEEHSCLPRLSWLELTYNRYSRRCLHVFSLLKTAVYNFQRISVFSVDPYNIFPLCRSAGQETKFG